MADDDGEFDEIPVDDFVVDRRDFTVRLPGGVVWAYEGDLDRGLIPEDSVRPRSLFVVAEALGILSELVEDGAPEGWFLEIDPIDRLYEIELHEGIALESYGTDQLYAAVSIGLQRYFDEGFERTIPD